MQLISCFRSTLSCLDMPTFDYLVGADYGITCTLVLGQHRWAHTYNSGAYPWAHKDVKESYASWNEITYITCLLEVIFNWKCKHLTMMRKEIILIGDSGAWPEKSCIMILLIGSLWIMARELILDNSSDCFANLCAVAKECNTERCRWH